MQKREKILAIALGSVVLLWFGLPILESSFVEPLVQLANDEERLQEEANEKFDEQLELRKKVKQLAQWRQKSLPPDPLNAQRLYQEWLVDLAQLSGFEGVVVTLERRVAQGQVFVTIPVTIEAKATLQELAQFIERFESVDLLHRIATCDVISPASEGNPDLQVTITAEGVSLLSAPERSRLFPQVELADGLQKDVNEIAAPDTASGFTEEPGFLVRIGDEFARVTSIDQGTWKLQRGVEKTFAEDHTPGETVELFPTVEERSKLTSQSEAMWSLSLFTKPAPQRDYDPQLASKTPPPAIRGEKWNWKLAVESWNPTFGTPMYSLIEAPAGMDLDERSGEISWPVDSQAEIGQQSILVVVWGSASKEAGFTSGFNLRVRDPNEPPELESQTPLKFFLGRTSTKRLIATDPDGDDDRLRFEVDGAPEGMQVNERDGTLTWTPSEALDPQTIDLRVTVTDSDEDAKSVTQTITILVEEDSARYTFLTTTFKKEFANGDEIWEAHLYDRATNETTILKEDETVEIADFELKIEKIGEDFVEVTRPAGRFRILFERPLVAMVKLAEPTEAAVVAPTENDETSNEQVSETPADLPGESQSSDSQTESPTKDQDADERS